jgi:hypothetical protein
MASKVFVLNNLVVSVDSVRLVQYENIQRGGSRFVRLDSIKTRPRRSRAGSSIRLRFSYAKSVESGLAPIRLAACAFKVSYVQVRIKGKI